MRVEIADDEGTGACLRVAPRRLYVPEDGTATFTVALCTKPTARGSGTPEVEFRIDAGGDLTTDPARLTFNESNWASGHTVTITARNDEDGANETVTIEITGASGTDGLYVGASAAVLTTVIDDDAGGLISPTAITVPEGGMGYYKAAIHFRALGQRDHLHLGRTGSDYKRLPAHLRLLELGGAAVRDRQRGRRLGRRGCWRLF